jgi:predicted transcriptional regulator
MSFSESAVKLGRIQVEFDCLYGTKEMLRRLTQTERVSELLRICNRENVSFKGFQYLERKLILDREVTP